MAEYDLTPRIIQYVDPHMAYWALCQLDDTPLYDERDLDDAKLTLLQKTKWVDEEIRLLKEIYGDDFQIPDELKARKAEYEKKDAELREAAKYALDIFIEAEDFNQIKEYMTAGSTDPPEKQAVKEKLTTTLPAYYDYAKHRYEMGDYITANELLGNYIAAIGDRAQFSTVRYSNALWGRLACLFHTQQWSEIKDAVEAIDKHITVAKKREEREPGAADSSPAEADPIRSMSDREKLQLRTWLLHWSLFCYQGPPERVADKWENILELVFLPNDDKQQGPGNGSDRYKQALQNNAPWLLRYVTSMVILQKKPLSDRFRSKQHLIKEVIHLIEQESYTYADPITQFLQCLYVRFDFDGAQEKLQACREVLDNDLFLYNHAHIFMEEARQLIFETYCRIHQKIDIVMLAQKLGMSPEAAERWIVNLIRDAKLVAKIDSKENYVLMESDTPSVHQQVLDRTDRITSSTFRIASDTQKLLGGGGGGERRPQAEQREEAFDDRQANKRASGLRDAAPTGGYGGQGRKPQYSGGGGYGQ